MPDPALRLPAYVDLRLLGRCNLSCPFCFGPRHEVPSMDEKDAFRVVELLRRAEVRGVVISGGEPTLLPYLADLVAELSGPLPSGAPGPRVVLSTNGLAPVRTMKRILPHLSWIALPVESADAEQHQRMRTGVAPHRERVLGLLKEVRTHHGHVRVKLGTVVTRLNSTGAHGVLDLIQEDDWLPHVWKIYQMSETNYGADNRDWLAVSDDVFEDVVERCAKTAADRGVQLQVYRNSTRSGSYLFVDPDCQVVVIDEGRERRIGDLFEDQEKIAANLQGAIDPTRNAGNFSGTYPDL
ncbi:radical SAM protein [Streptomyces gilvifuscus]|uniref:Radical SAM protein n=1 Tax=Streptomyces gilvifuscus TaxID=1550617 RepID=A0ABT5G087_9ACTN|nr:radical SAM protein [Streptomyces gilvifuscus]MDC2958111.1 radical SAM protein [Streptomyces gilvifuscus]